MTNKILLSLFTLAFPIYAISDPGSSYDDMYDGVMHEEYHEPLHVTNKNKHDKGSVDFAKADKNNDGKLTKKEAKTLRNVSKNFELIDVDKDGTLDRDEIHIYMKTKNK
jgi:hypothetical protein